MTIADDHSRADDLRPGDFVTPSVRLVRPIGQGGMGTVWLAEHLVLDTRVVVKLMAKGLEGRADVLARFAREAMVAAQVKSPHVVQVFDSGTTASGAPYIVMELLEGHDLGKHLTESGPLSPHALVGIVVQVAKALAKAHRVGVVHRDIKPDNIFLCDTEPSSSGERGEPFVKLLDFGTAKVGLPTRRDMTSTDTGQVLGTPLYMSPEQILGQKEIDTRTDIWSLGIVVFEALTGRTPFEGATIAALALAIHGEPPKMTDFVPDLPPALDRWFSRACAQKPEDRFPTVREAADAFVHAATGAPMLEPFESMRAPATVQIPAFPAPTRAPMGAPIARAQATTVRPVQLVETLPKPGSERRSVTVAFGVVVAAALAVSAVIVARSPAPAAIAEASTASEATAAAEATAATPPPAAPAPAPAPAPETDRDEPTPRSGAATVAAAPAAPKPNPPMTRGPRATVTKRPARAKDGGSASAAAPGPAAPAPAPAPTPAPAPAPAPAPTSDDDLVQLSNLPAPAPSVEPPPAPVAPQEPVSPPELPAE